MPARYFRPRDAGRRTVFPRGQPFVGIDVLLVGKPVQGEGAAFGCRRRQVLQRQAEAVIGGEEEVQAAPPALRQQAVQTVEAV